MSDTTPRPDETPTDPTAQTAPSAPPPPPPADVEQPEAAAPPPPPADVEQPEAAAPPPPPADVERPEATPPPPADVEQPEATPPPPPPAEPVPSPVPPVTWSADPAGEPFYGQQPPPPPAYPAPTGQQPPAYPAPTGQQVVPTPMSPSDERTWGMLAHGIPLLALVLSAGALSFVASLVTYIVVRDRGPFVRHHAANALNVQIIAGIVMLVSLPLMLVLIGFVTFAAAWLFAVVVHIVGAVKANSGEWYTPPMTPQFVK